MARPKIIPANSTWIKFWITQDEQKAYQKVLKALERRRQDDLKGYINKLVKDYEEAVDKLK